MSGMQGFVFVFRSESKRDSIWTRDASQVSPMQHTKEQNCFEFQSFVFGNICIHTHNVASWRWDPV